MLLRSLATRNFRNLTDATYEFHPSANLILGGNGQGKTNLLEAICFLATTRSFRTPRGANLIRIGETSTQVEGALEEGGITRRLSIGIEHEGNERRRELLVNAGRVTLHDYAGIIPLFAYSAARLEIMRGGPDERRRFLDRGIASIDRGYSRTVSRYQRALKQRNALLPRVAAGELKPGVLEPWDEELIMAGEPVVSARTRYVEALREVFDAVVESHRYHVRDVELRYAPAGIQTGRSRAELIGELRRLRARELRAGFSLFGPHRDQIELVSAGRPAADVLSSGEQKMVVLFLKFSKFRLFREKFDTVPIFLLDDVDAELDLGIIERLLDFLVGSVQLFTTSAKESVVAPLELGNHRKFFMELGAATRVEDGVSGRV